jgi:hypothetical protein
MLFLHRLFSDSRYRFSVETPTCEPYGTGRASGLVDVSLFKSGHEIEAHFEFKEGLHEEGIQTSLNKIIREGEMGGWFHKVYVIRLQSLEQAQNLLEQLKTWTMPSESRPSVEMPEVGALS